MGEITEFCITKAGKQGVTNQTPSKVSLGLGDISPGLQVLYVFKLYRIQSNQLISRKGSKPPKKNMRLK